MTDGNEPQLQDLEPLDPGESQSAPGPAGASVDEATLQALRAGLAPPAYNPMCRDTTSYRFLMCGVLLVIGSLMPFGANYDQVGYKTMSGAVFLFIGLGMTWTWWGAIHNNRSSRASFKWLLLCFVPLIAQVMNLVAYDPVAALQNAKDTASILYGQTETCASWRDLFGDMMLALSKKADSGLAAMRVETFFRCFGTGRLFVLFGAMLAEFYLVAGIAGGAKQNKQQKQARMTQAAERKRR